MGKKLTAVRLNLELKHNYLLDYEKRMLRRYGESCGYNTVSRDILIPSDMSLHNLHYAIQRLFGWRNTHQRRFYLPKERYDELTGATVKGWSELVGIIFQSPSEAEKDIYWDDDYCSGSINGWLKQKYTGPYVFKGSLEDTLTAQNDVKRLMDHFPNLEVEEPYEDYWERLRLNENEEIRIVKTAPLVELTIEEVNSTVLAGEVCIESILERLLVVDVLASQKEILPYRGRYIPSTDTDKGKELFPLTTEIVYNYDFGDNWEVFITKHDDCNDLLEENIIDQFELENAREKVIKNHQPVCINKRGISVFEDIGGLSGFANFLGRLYESDDKGEANYTQTWAISQGWADKKKNVFNIL